MGSQDRSNFAGEHCKKHIEPSFNYLFTITYPTTPVDLGDIPIGTKRTLTILGTNLKYAFNNDHIVYDYGAFELTPNGKFTDTEIEVDIYGDEPVQNCTIFAEKIIIEDGKEINIGEQILFKYNFVN